MEEGGRSPLSFLRIDKKYANFVKRVVLFLCIYGLYSQLKCSFKSILEKKQESFSLLVLLFYVADEVFIEVPLFQEIYSAPQNSWLRAGNFHLNFSS